MKILKIVLIDNYSDGLPKHRLDALKSSIGREVYYLELNGNSECALRSLDSDPKLIIIKEKNLSSKTIFDFALNADCLILSGGPYFLSQLEIRNHFNNEIRLISSFSRPILGICFGHQLIAHAFGYPIRPLNGNKIEKGVFELDVLSGHPLWNKTSIVVEESHQEEIKIDSDSDFYDLFNNYASSEACHVQMIKHKSKPIFGCQFHPESLKSKEAECNGKFLIQNFLKYAFQWNMQKRLK